MRDLSSTERDTLRHICKFDNRKLEFIESLDLNDSQRAFLIFDIILNAHEKGRKLERKVEIKKAKESKSIWNKFKNIFK